MTIVDDLEVAWFSGNHEVLVLPLNSSDWVKTCLASDFSCVILSNHSVIDNERH